MAKVSMRRQGFSDERIIERVECNKVRYNTRISKPENCEVVIVSGEQPRRLNNLDDGMLNPKKKRFWQRNKKDPSEHIVFFMDAAYHEACWGGNVLYIDPEDNKRKKVFIRTTFAFKIFRADRTLLLLSETKEKYSKKYLIDKLRLRVDNTIKTHLGKELKEHGFIEAQNNLLEVAEAIEEKVNTDVLAPFGLSMAFLNIVLEEAEEVSYEEKKGA